MFQSDYNKFSLQTLNCILLTLLFIYGCDSGGNRQTFNNSPELSPFITAISPTSGSASGGTSVQINGTNFTPYAGVTYTCTFGASQAFNIQMISNSEITCVTPPGTVGAIVDVVLTNNIGLSSTLEDAFTYTAADVVDFTANDRIFTVGNTVQFTDLSTNAVDWSWDLNGDGTIDSTLENPTFTYTTAGSFDVTLTINTATLGNSTTLTRVDFILVGNAGVSVIAGTPGTVFLSIQSAIDALPPLVGGIVVVGAGVYDEALEISRGGVITVLGSDPTTTIIRPTLGVTLNRFLIETDFTAPGAREVISIIDIGDNVNVGPDFGAGEETFDTTLTLQNLTIDGTTVSNIPGATDGINPTAADRFYGVFVRPRVDATLQNCVITGIRRALPSFSFQTEIAFFWYNRTATGNPANSVTLENCSFLDFGKGGLTISSDPDVSITPLLADFTMNNCVIEGIIPTVQISQNGIQISSTTFGFVDSPSLNITLTDNEFRNFGPSGDGSVFVDPLLDIGLVASDLTIGYALLFYDLGGLGTTTISGNTFTECQGVLADIAGDPLFPILTAGEFFSAGNTITGNRYFTGVLPTSNYIDGQLTIDSNALNSEINLFNVFPTIAPTVPDIITIGSGTYTLTSNMLAATVNPFGLVINVNGGTAVIDTPNGTLGSGITLGAGVTIQ
ncbi:MAG: IPT/TIG domain-containing protein [Planctomycetota bacterium]